MIGQYSPYLPVHFCRLKRTKSGRIDKNGDKIAIFMDIREKLIFSHQQAYR